MKRRISFGTLDSRIYTIFTVMIFLTIFVMQLVSFRFTISRIRKSFIENSQAMLVQLVEQIDNYIIGMKNLSEVIASDEEVKEFLLDPSDSDSPLYQSIQTRLYNYIQARDDISDILVADLDEHIISADPDAVINPWNEFEEKAWFLDALRSYDNTVVSTAYVQNIIQGRYSWVVSLSRGIQSVRHRDTTGVLLIDLKFNRIKELCQSLVTGTKGYNFVIDGKGNYVYHPTQQLVYSDLRSEPITEILQLAQAGDPSSFLKDDRHLMVATSPNTQWHVVSVVHESDIITDWRYVQLTYSLIGFILFLVIGIATNRVSSGITQPVRKLQHIMQSVDTGEFRLVGNIRATDEIRELAREYDTMVGKIRELMEANTHEQELKRKSDLKALQAQINPHFLYNTLDSIIWMAEMGLNERVVQMTSALSKLFRISISKGRELIPLEDEVAHVQSYLTIQEMRYKDKFSYDIQIAPELMQETILKITLQPLVENAIYHGVKELNRKGSILITGKVVGDEMHLSVSDNGMGMDAQSLDKLQQSLGSSLEDWSNNHSQGMGVKNVHERIRIYFGHRYGLTITSTPGEGTRILVRIPIGVEGDEA